MRTTVHGHVTQQLAVAFSQMMRERWSPGDTGSRTIRFYPESMCATYDVLAAAEAMMEAFKVVTGHAPQSESEADAALWAAAWVRARNERFFVEQERPRREADKAANGLHDLYRNAKAWHTGGGCFAFRIECADGGYLLITDCEGARIPDVAATEVQLGRYAENGDVVDEASIVAVSDLQARIDASLERAKNPRSVADYFTTKLRAGHLYDGLQDMPMDSPCGQDCIKVIDAAAALIEHCHIAAGKPDIEYRTGRVAREIARQVVGVYCNG